MFRAIVDSAVASILVIDGSGTVQFCNKAGLKLFFRDDTSIEGGCITDFLPNSEMIDGELVVHGIRQAFGFALITLTTPSGEKRGFNVRHDLELDEKKNKLNILRMTDVTEEVATQKALSAQKERWDLALKGSQIGIFESDLRANEGSATNTWFHLFGVEDPADLDSDKFWHERVHPDDLQGVLDSDASCVYGDKERSDTKYRVLHEDGQWHWMHSVLLVAERDASGKAIRLLGTMTDITELRQAMELAKERENQLRRLIASAPVPMAVLSPDGRFQITNEACQTFLGYSADDLLESSLWALGDRQMLADLQNEIKSLLDGSIDVYAGEKTFQRPDGAEIEFAIRFSKLHGESGNYRSLIVQFIDITEQNRVARLKDNFIATVSHELRTPLASISGALGLMQAMSAERLDEKALNLLTIASRNGQRLKELVDDLLDFQHLSSGALSLKIAPVNIIAIVDQAVEEIQPFAQKLEVGLSFQHEPQQLTGNLDPVRFKQIIVNLLSNAIKFSTTGEMVMVQVTHSQGFCCVAVTNKGIGIAPEFREHIFRPFSQQADPATRDREGSGLGLAISKGLIERMRGSIGYESVPNGQTTFWIRLPLEEMPETITEKAL